MYNVSPNIIKATKLEYERNPNLKEIIELSDIIEAKKKEIIELETKVYQKKLQLPKVIIPWRESVDWCLTVDSNNPGYFLKNAGGVYKCVAYKHQIEVTADIKNKVAITLACLHREHKIGRIKMNGGYYYGLSQFFKEDLTELKDEYKILLNKLIL